MQIAVGTQGARNRGPRRVAFGKAGRSRSLKWPLSFPSLRSWQAGRWPRIPLLNLWGFVGRAVASEPAIQGSHPTLPSCQLRAAS